MLVWTHTRSHQSANRSMWVIQGRTVSRAHYPHTQTKCMLTNTQSLSDTAVLFQGAKKNSPRRKLMLSLKAFLSSSNPIPEDPSWQCVSWKLASVAKKKCQAAIFDGARPHSLNTRRTLIDIGITYWCYSLSEKCGFNLIRLDCSYQWRGAFMVPSECIWKHRDIQCFHSKIT